MIGARTGLAVTAVTSSWLGLAAAPVGAQAGPSAVQDAVAFQMTPGHSGFSPDPVGPTWTKAWSMDLGGPLSSPLIVGGTVYVVAETSSPSIYAIDGSTGAVRWQLAVGAGTSGVAYADGRLFTVSGGGIMAAADARTGATEWAAQLPDQSLFGVPPTADGSMVYTGAAGVGGTVYGVSAATGDLAWTGSVENGDDSIPAVSSTGMYVSYACQQTYDFDPRTGTPLWHYSTGCEGGGGATPVLADGYLFVQDPGPGYLVLNATTGAAVRTIPSGLAPPAADATAVFAENGGQLQARTVASGHLEWTFPGDGRLDTSPIVVGGTVYEGSTTGTVFGVSAATGRPEWRADVHQPVTGPLAEGDDLLAIPAGDWLTVFEPTGS
jgi:outer membrane protein assembly factor BamB